MDLLDLTFGISALRKEGALAPRPTEFKLFFYRLDKADGCAADLDLALISDGRLDQINACATNLDLAVVFD